MRFFFNPEIAICFFLLALCLLLCHEGVQAQDVEDAEEEKLPRFELEYGFFEINEEPTVEEINTLMCAHNQYYTERYQFATNNPTVIYEAQDIDWTYTPGDEKPLAVSLNANITALDGGETPSTGDIVEGNVAIGENFTDYIQNYAWPLGGIWNMVNSMYYQTSVSGPADTVRLEEAICEPLTTEAPTEENATPVPTTGATGTNPAMTTAPSEADNSIVTMSPTSITGTESTATSAPSEGGNATGRFFHGLSFLFSKKINVVRVDYYVLSRMELIPAFFILVSQCHSLCRNFSSNSPRWRCHF